MKAQIVLLAVFLALSGVVGLGAQQGFPGEDWAEAKGDPAVAERYVSWIEEAIAAGQWQQARAALERANDFADVSSDVSYLLARSLIRENSDRGQILRALSRAISTRRWVRYTEADARLLQTQQLIALRRYSSALETLTVRRAAVGDDADSAMLRLEALKGLVFASVLPDGEAQRWRQAETLPAPAEFRRRLLEAMDRYPRDSRPLRLFFDYAGRREPTRDDTALMEIALRRLPFLLETDPELAWMAAPFITDVDEARRLVGAYRSGSLLSRTRNFSPVPASIALALNLGLLDDTDAVNELFDAAVTLDKDIILSVSELLRSEEGRNSLAEKLHSFTGTITEDEDRDGIPESRAMYLRGALREWHSDIDQDGLNDIAVVFDTGLPQQAELYALPAAGSEGAKAQVHWERYPSVQRVVLGRETYLFTPGGFMFALVGFEELCATGTYAALLFPRHDLQTQGLTRRMLSSFAVSVQRPNAEFEGGVESLSLVRGVPYRAEVVLGGAVVAVTEFENGFPMIQRVDLDRDGRMETVRRFRPAPRGGIESAAIDQNGDGVFEYVEMYREDGSVVYSWSFDLQ